MTELANLLDAWTVSEELYNTNDAYEELAFVFSEKKQEFPIFVKRVPICCGAVAVFSTKPLPISLKKKIHDIFSKTGLLVMLINISMPKLTNACGPLHVFSGKLQYHYADIIRHRNTLVKNTLPKNYVIKKASSRKGRKTFRVSETTVMKWSENVYFMYGLHSLTPRVVNTIVGKLKPTDHLFGIRADAQYNAAFAYQQTGIPSCFETINPSGGSRLYLHWRRGLDTTTKNVKLKPVSEL